MTTHNRVNRTVINERLHQVKDLPLCEEKNQLNIYCDESAPVSIAQSRSQLALRSAPIGNRKPTNGSLASTIRTNVKKTSFPSAGDSRAPLRFNLCPIKLSFDSSLALLCAMACLIVQIKLKKRTRPNDEHETEEKKRVAPESGLARGLLFALGHMPRTHRFHRLCFAQKRTRCFTHLRYDYNLIYSFCFFPASVERQ